MNNLKPRSFGTGPGGTVLTEQVQYKDEKLARDQPWLYEFLTREWWEDNKPREKGTLIIFYEEGKAKACLSDKDADAVAFVSKDSLQQLLVALEKGLREDSLDWRLTRAGKGKKQK